MPRCPSLHRSAAVVVAAVTVALCTAPTAGALSPPAAQADRYFHTWATDVNLRVDETDPNTCRRHPSVRLPGVPDCPGMTGATGSGAIGTGTPVAARSGHTFGPYSVTAYETVNIRSEPNTSSRAFDRIRAGQTRSDALCWAHGETVRDHGYTNDVWIGFTEGWASAVYLKGNEYAGLPADATC